MIVHNFTRILSVEERFKRVRAQVYRATSCVLLTDDQFEYLLSQLKNYHQAASRWNKAAFTDIGLRRLFKILRKKRAETMDQWHKLCLEV